jgi:LysR family transcriptional activator of nhaA
MEMLNYHHLFYFYVVAREGSIARACEYLGVTQPTISAQLGELEDSLGEPLFRRVGRNRELTEQGRVVFGYAEEIFGLGREMLSALRGKPRDRPVRLTVGVADVLPDLVVARLLEPAATLTGGVQLVCVADKTDRLLADLVTHKLDVILTDMPVSPTVKIRAFSHFLGECGVTFVGARHLAEHHRDGFPGSLDGAPMLLPVSPTALRRQLEQWFDAIGIRPSIRGEFAGASLLKVFGQRGDGLFAVPTVIEAEVCRQYSVEPVGRAERLTERFYALSIERRLKNPAVLAVSEAARTHLFAS